MKTLPLLLLAASLFPISAIAQNDAPKSIRIIPLGEQAKFDWKLEKGIRVQIPPPKDQSLPRQIAISDVKKGPKTMGLTLNMFSKTVQIGADAKQLKIFEGKSAIGQPWLTSPAPGKAHNLVVLYPDPKTNSWIDAKMMVLADGKEALPAGKARLINLSHQTILVKFGKAKAEKILPGKTLIKKLGKKGEIVRIGYKKTGSDFDILNGGPLNVKKGERVQIFFHNARLKDPTKSWVKCIIKPEKVPAANLQAAR